jgi:hypothetical protein
MIRAAFVVIAVAGCTADEDVCAGRPDACIALRVDGPIAVVDLLELDLLYGDVHATTTVQRPGETTAPPIVVPIELVLDEDTHVGIVAAGKLGGNVLGTGAVAVELGAVEHRALSIVLAAPQDCTAGAFYCGGDMLAGDPQTLYQCNAGGVPLARGRCRVACSVRPADDDACTDPEPCVEGGRYCGGDKLTGDPRSLYTCTGGAGTNRMECSDGCIVRPPGQDDTCR